MFSRKACLVGLLSLMGSISFASEAASTEAVEVKPYSGHQTQDWEKVQGRLTTLKAKVDAQEVLVKNLAAEKTKLQGQALVTKVEELKKEYATLRTVTAEYNQLNEEYLTKYPERGLKEKRIYPRIETKSLDAYENDMSVSGRVNRVHKKILQKYSRSKQEKAATPSEVKEESTSSGESKNTQSAEPSGAVTDPIHYKQ